MSDATGTLVQVGASTTARITASAYSSFATPVISIPFPSGYGQTQLAFTANAAAVSGNPSITIGGSGSVASPTFPVLAGDAKGFVWPSWATIVVAAAGGLFLCFLIGLFIWCCVRRRRRENRLNSAQRTFNRERIVSLGVDSKWNSSIKREGSDEKLLESSNARPKKSRNSRLLQSPPRQSPVKIPVQRAPASSFVPAAYPMPLPSAQRSRSTHRYHRPNNSLERTRNTPPPSRHAHRTSGEMPLLQSGYETITPRMSTDISYRNSPEMGSDVEWGAPPVMAQIRQNSPIRTNSPLRTGSPMRVNTPLRTASPMRSEHHRSPSQDDNYRGRPSPQNSPSRNGSPAYRFPTPLPAQGGQRPPYSRTPSHDRVAPSNQSSGTDIEQWRATTPQRAEFLTPINTNTRNHGPISEERSPISTHTQASAYSQTSPSNYSAHSLPLPVPDTQLPYMDRQQYGDTLHVPHPLRPDRSPSRPRSRQSSGGPRPMSRNSQNSTYHDPPQDVGYAQ